MSKKLNSLFSVKKVVKSLKMKETNYKPCDYELYEVTGPKGINKLFAHLEDANVFIATMIERVKANVTMNKLVSDIKLADTQID